MRRHPHFRTSWRWTVTRQPAWKLLAVTVSALFLVAGALAALQALATASPTSLSHRFSPGRFATAVVGHFRALVNTQPYPSVPGAERFDTPASVFSSTVALIIPAVIVAVVFARIFSVDPFTWRRQVSLCLPWEVDDDVYREENANTHNGALAIRFYKRLRRLTVSDLNVEVFLRFVESSKVDGTQIIRTVPLNVLGPSGQRVRVRVWPISFSGTTFTIWVPMDEKVDGAGIRRIQGFDIVDSDVQQLLVRVRGRVSGLGIDVSDEQWFSLRTGDVQIGRFAPIATDLASDPARWSGWDRFEEPARQGLFVYGRLLDPEALRDFSDHQPRPGTDYVRARIHGMRRTWSVATDNGDPGRRLVYVEPGTGQAPAVQLLFLNLEGDPGAITEGILLVVTSDLIARLDSREGNFTVEDVTSLVEPSSPLAGGALDKIWTYMGRPESVAAARNGLAAGTARILDDFLAEVTRGMSSYDTLLRKTFEAAEIPPVEHVTLVRRHRDARFDRDLSSEQG